MTTWHWHRLQRRADPMAALGRRLHLDTLDLHQEDTDMGALGAAGKHCTGRCPGGQCLLLLVFHEKASLPEISRGGGQQAGVGKGNEGETR